MRKEDSNKFRIAYRIITLKNPKDADKKKAFSLWKELSENGYLRSSFYLGVCYDTGFGVRNSYEKAFSSYMLAAESGHAEARYNVYKMFKEGIGVKKNSSEAIKWLKKAAIENRDVGAIRDLGYCYFMGDGVAKDYELAVYYYKVAAKKGDCKAQWNLGLSYKYGDGVKKSRRWSRYWMRKAADQGHKKAIELLGKR